MIDISTDPDYSEAYREMTKKAPRPVVSSPEVDAALEADNNSFMSRVDDILLRIIFHQVLFFHTEASCSIFCLKIGKWLEIFVSIESTKGPML